MAISLQKGQKINLSKDNAGLNKVVIGLGWDEAKQKKGLFSKPKPIDCDALVMLTQNSKLVTKDDVVFYGNLHHYTGAIQHMGDNLTGAGAGDDEQITIDLANIPMQYDKIIFAVNIYEAKERKQHFGMIQNAFVRVVDGRNNSEICRYNLTDNYSNMTTVVFGELQKINNEWNFNAIDCGYQGDLFALWKIYGLNC